MTTEFYTLKGSRIVEDLTSQEGHSKRLYIKGDDGHGNTAIIAVCECNVDMLEEMVQEYKAFVKTGKLPERDEKDEEPGEGETSYHR